MKNNKEKNYNGKQSIWAVILIIIAAIDAFLLVEYFWIKHHPITGMLFGLLIITDLLILGILGIAFTDKKMEMSIIDAKELKSATTLLRYATAILSFLSLMTTANGMKSFVFDTDWKAYFGSFAVQSILVVFSLLLCHFYVMIGTLSNLSEAGRALMIGVLTLFFATALVVSSGFSFVYISENAYKNTWAGDAEVLIQEYLVRETNAINLQNTHLSKLFLEDIGNSIQQTLERDAKNYWDQKEEEVKEMISHFQMDDYSGAESDIKTIDITSTIANLRNSRNARLEELDEIENAYNNVGMVPLQRAFNDYAIMVDEVSNLGEADLSSIQDQLNKTSEKLQEIDKNIKKAIEGIEKLRTGNYVNDITPRKTIYSSVATTFRNFIQNQKKHVDEAITEINNANNNTVGINEESVTDRIEDIRKRIYLLNSKTDNLDSEIEGIVKSISQLLEQLSTDDIVTTESVGSLTSLSEKINEYGRSLRLSRAIQKFSQDNLGQTYSFSGNYRVTEDTWKASRNDDFHEFLSILYGLPDPIFLENDYRIKYEQENYKKTADILKEAGIMRRDLLGELTGFEKCLNYLKNDFRKMAIFSAFIAVFLDLGAFLTGCFLYSTRLIQLEQIKAKSEKEHEDDNSQESKPDEEQEGDDSQGSKLDEEQEDDDSQGSKPNE